MTKKEYCETHPICGLWSDSAFFNFKAPGIDVHGIEVHGIEQENLEDYIYYAHVCGDNKTYHKNKIRYYNSRPYFNWKGIDIFLDEILRV